MTENEILGEGKEAGYLGEFSKRLILRSGNQRVYKKVG